MSDFVVDTNVFTRNGRVWNVYLPHACDEYEIVWAYSKEEAITQMEQFIAEANEALNTLREA